MLLAIIFSLIISNDYHHIRVGGQRPGNFQDVNPQRNHAFYGLLEQINQYQQEGSPSSANPYQHSSNQRDIDLFDECYLTYGDPEYCDYQVQAYIAAQKRAREAVISMEQTNLDHAIEANIFANKMGLLDFQLKGVAAFMGHPTDTHGPWGYANRFNYFQQLNASFR